MGIYRLGREVDRQVDVEAGNSTVHPAVLVRQEFVLGRTCYPWNPVAVAHPWVQEAGVVPQLGAGKNRVSPG